jgi:hypothetical protein
MAGRSGCKTGELIKFKRLVCCRFPLPPPQHNDYIISLEYNRTMSTGNDEVHVTIRIVSHENQVDEL